MLFYQVVLLAGYAYAHFLTQKKRLRNQLLIHLGVVIAPLIVFAIGPPIWAPPAANQAVQWLLLYLLAAIGAPFFVLSTNAPLLQKWFGSQYQNSGKSAYSLYSASNAGSMLALLSYPLLIERQLRLGEQYILLKACYAAFVIVMLAIMFNIAKAQKAEVKQDGVLDSLKIEKVPLSKLIPQRLWWTFLAFVPSSLLLSITTYITSDIAPCPLLWVVPLALYLLTFIIAFSEKKFINQNWLTVLFSACLIVLSVMFFWKPVELLFVFMFPLHLLTFFLASLLCHTRLAHSKPESHRLTEFYLCLSIGGALGGIFNTLIAPQIFNRLYEYPLGLLLSCSGITNSSRSESNSDWRPGGLLICASLLSIAVLFEVSRNLAQPLLGYRALFVLAPAAIFSSFSIRKPQYMAACLFIVFCTGAMIGRPEYIFEKRNIFGSLAVARGPGDTHLLIHGAILHGAEKMDEGSTPEPLTYYHHESPIGHIFSAYNDEWRNANIAVVGLGTGTLAAYAQPDQHWTFYEINPMVVDVAQNSQLFTYLQFMQGHKSIEVGDGRQSISQAKDKSLQLIVLDAFSSDSIPVHLLTREALKLYESKLTEQGLIVFHISSRAVDLSPVLRELAKDAGFACLMEEVGGGKDKLLEHKLTSKWLVMARKPQYLARLQQQFRFAPPPEMPSVSLWTDDFSNIFESLHIRGPQ